MRFYHLTERPLEAVLPVMLERCLERGWRAVVRGTSAERLDALDALLWSYDEASFLPHGRAGRAPGEPSDHPVWLTEGAELPNAPDTLFLIDGAEAEPAALAAFATVALLFDGSDAGATERARDAWRAVTGAGLRAVYWAEDGRGGWSKRAEAGGDGA